MCGVVGIISSDSIVERNNLQNSIAILNHRGPDCQKVWISADGKVGLGHARLSIIDLVTGDQPLASEDKKYYLVANGEFYQYERLRAQLKKLGHRFLTKSDSEIVLYLYKDLGVDCLKHLRGEFAFILWDEEQKTCFAARDRFGIKPLYYSIINNTLYLASEVKALFTAGVKAEWDVHSMSLYASSSLIPQSRTLYKNIFQVPPGHYLLFKNGQSQIVKYWDLNFPEAKDHDIANISADDYTHMLRNKLNEAIQIRLRADVPVACYLSGGLDSSTVLGFAAKNYHKQMPAFTLSFDDEEYDEEKIAKEMAEKANASFQPIAIKQSDLAKHFDEAIWHGETFLFNGHCVAKFLLSKAVRDAGYKVVLTGEGADELFAGYPHFRLDHLFYGQYKNDPEKREKLLNTLEKNNLVSLGIVIPEITSHQSFKMESVQKLLGYTPAWLLMTMQGGLRMSEVFSDDFKFLVNQNDSYKIALESIDIKNQLTSREPLNQSLYLWIKFRMCDYILTVLGDRMEMAHSLEGRLPLLDHHIAEFMRDVPVNLKIHEMTEKYLLREAALPVLTKTVYERQKHPFLAPPALLNKDQPFHDLLQTTLRSESFKQVPFFNQSKIIKLLDKIPNMSLKERIAWDTVLMIILSIAKLQEKFGLTCGTNNLTHSTNKLTVSLP